MPGDFQVISGSVVGENRRSPALNETPVEVSYIHFLSKIFFMIKWP